MFDATHVQEQAQRKLDVLRHEARVARALPRREPRGVLRTLRAWSGRDKVTHILDFVAALDLPSMRFY
ncbi:hypothetical protein [Deinococcus yavapaiensis]|uniref:Uncharacterized protein n=1 Tax=Deinococcus yavapaiensis KR-236 TaxID=694435 RepID=A0A318S6J2_9DEIO|nr:hypothetical protein [Deinococcus yavapaiensis]PYE53833.1 hypothetical protein DES52_10791 [Deinococcus yavapaiensis KR-236]